MRRSTERILTRHTGSLPRPDGLTERFAGLVGRENVIAGTDCGFATFADLSWVHPAIVWAKVESMVEGAELATRELWRRS